MMRKAQLKANAKTLLWGLYRYSGLLPLQESLAVALGRRPMAVLLFHRVTDAIPEDGLTVSTARFRAICGMLRRSFHAVPLAEVYRLARSGERPRPRTVAVTFDDCYQDNLPAARVLAEHGIPASFFVPTAFVGTDHVFPWDRHLPRMPNLTWDEVREMVRLGHEIGSHTATHADLGTATADQVRRELAESKAVLEDRLGRPVRYLAYPFGGPRNFRRDWLPLLEEAGYEGCLSGYGGLIYPHTDTGILPRENVPSFESVLYLGVHLTGCLDWYYRLKRRTGLSRPWQPRESTAASPDTSPEVASLSAAAVRG